MAITEQDINFMKTALGLARRGLGMVAPNPAVGCVLVKDGVIVGRGWTQPGGRPHAETVALAQAREKAAGSTAYVTLEPCAHTGKTPPCADALIEAGIVRCLVAAIDSDPRVGGQGIAKLVEAGIDVETGVLADEGRDMNRGFFLKVEKNRPQFTLKLATSFDGRIALESGESQWITGMEARRYGHLLRAQHDAILIGGGTLGADDPSLDCRLAGLEDRSPIAIILDGGLRLAPGHKLARAGTLLFHTRRDAAKEQELKALGVDLLPGDTRDLGLVANKLAERGITRVLIEGGGQVHASFLKAGLADRVEHFVAGKAIGKDGKAAIGPLGLASLAKAPHLTLEKVRHLGPDILASYVQAE